MVGHAGNPTAIVHADVTLTRSKVKVKVTELLNFRQLSKPCMLSAMTTAPFRGFLVEFASRKVTTRHESSNFAKYRYFTKFKQPYFSSA